MKSLKWLVILTAIMVGAIMAQQSMLRKKVAAKAAQSKTDVRAKAKNERPKTIVTAAVSNTEGVKSAPLTAETPPISLPHAPRQNAPSTRGSDVIITSVPDVAALPKYALPKSTILASVKQNAVYRCMTRRDCNLCAESLEFMNGFSAKESEEMRARVCKSDCPTLCNGKKS